MQRGSATSTTYKPRLATAADRARMADSSYQAAGDDPATGGALIPPFVSKIAILVRDDLLTWQRLNVTAFLASGMTAANPQLVGRPYADADGQQYLALIGMPILVFVASGELLAQSRARALQRGVPVALYTWEMFGTGHDAANRAAVAAIEGANLDLVGVAVHGPKNAVDKIAKGASLHP